MASGTWKRACFTRLASTHRFAVGSSQNGFKADGSACPTADHVRLLLTLLGAERPIGTPQKGAKDEVVSMESAPGMIVLWDLGRLFMEQIEEDENLPPDTTRESVGEWKFKPG